MATNEMPKRRRSPAIAERPNCPLHGDTMSAGSSPGRMAYYYCSVADCQHSQKVARVYKDVKDNPRKAP